MFDKPPVPKSVKESVAESAFVEWCAAEGILQEKLVILGKRNFPDRTVFLGGGSICCIEFKAPGKKARKGQDRYHELLRCSGVPCLTTDDLSEAIQWVTKLRGGRPRQSGPRISTRRRPKSS